MRVASLFYLFEGLLHLIRGDFTGYPIFVVDVGKDILRFDMLSTIGQGLVTL